jgi:hypothetical protein
MKVQDPLKRRLVKMRELLKIQGAKGNWDYDNYMLGMYNGMEVMMCTAEDREPKFRTAHFYGPISKELREGAIKGKLGGLSEEVTIFIRLYRTFEEGMPTDFAEWLETYRVFVLLVAEAISERDL